MEEKLFWIGILMGIHLLLSHIFKDKGKFRADSTFARSWHSFFCAVSGFIIMVLIAVSLDNRRGDTSTTILFSAKEIYYGLFGALAGAVYSWINWKNKDKTLKDPKAKEKENKDKDKKTEKENPEKVEKRKLLAPIITDMEWSETVFSAVILASFVMYFFVQAFKIPSGSMENTFLIGDHLFVNKIVYGLRIPYTDFKPVKLFKVKRGDIVIFRFPTDDPNEFQCGGQQYGRDFIKRVVGLPGETIQIKDGLVYINGQLQEPGGYEIYSDQQRYPSGTSQLKQEELQKLWVERKLGRMYSDFVRDNFGPVTVPKGYYFVMGDNRDRSCDSRYWGPVPESRIKGKAWFTYWPPTRIGFPI